MLKLFRSGKKKIVNPLAARAAGALAAKIEWLQTRWTAFMHHRVNRLSQRSKKFGLTGFVLLSICICVSILIETFSTAHHDELNFGRMRKVILQHHAVTVPTFRQYDKVSSFRKYMDSLAATAQGKRIYDSINTARPGLLDSAKALEKLYHHQNK